METSTSFPHSTSSLWSSCQPNIQRRINALLNYQAEYFHMRVDFHQQLQQLQYAYDSQFEQILHRRRQVIQGAVASPEPLLPSSDDQPNISSDLCQTGIPNFWVTVLKNLDSYDYPIRSRDEACLQYLTDIRCVLHPPELQSTSFILEFHFSPSNPFFVETVLTKSYFVRFQFDDSYPYRSYDGPEVDRCHGCPITWHAERNLTVRKRTKRMRNKATGEIRISDVEEAVPSFFDFFTPPTIPEDGIDALTDEEQIRLEADFEFGLLLKQQILPRAVLYYTGEAVFVDDSGRADEGFTSSESSQ